MTQDNSRLPPHVYGEPDDGVGWVQCRKCHAFGLLGVERTGPCDLVYAQDVEAWLEHWRSVTVNERPSTVDVLEAIMRGEGPLR